MRTEIEIRNASRDPDLDAFIDTTIGFAVWDPQIRFESAKVVVEAASRGARCGISVTSEETGTVSAGAVGSDLYEAIANAAELLEVAIRRRRMSLSGAARRAPRRRAAMPVLSDPVHAA